MTYRDITVAQPWHIQPFLEKKKKKKRCIEMIFIFSPKNIG